MKTILEWLKPGARVKRYILVQLISIAVLMFCVVSLGKVYDLNKNMLIAYIALITISIFGIVFSFILAQKNILYISLKNIANKSKNIKVRKMLYADPRRKKAPRVVVIGGGSGLPNVLKGLKEYTSNITALVNVSEDDLSLSSAQIGREYLTPGDIRKCISALSTSESELEKMLTFKEEKIDGNVHSVGNDMVSALIKITGSFSKAVEKLPEIFKMQGKIYPVTTENIVLCAGLENGEVVVGKQNIIERVKEIKSPIKQIFLKEGSISTVPKVLEAIKNANVIVFGPGSLYTSIASNFLLEDISKAIIKSKAKKVYIANIMNQPGQTDGYTLARYVNEIERYIGKHVLDYAIVNNGKITDEMLEDFNQQNSSPVKIDLENIQNRAISVVKHDLILTSPGAITHDPDKLAGIIMAITKSKKTGNLNIVKIKRKHLKHEKLLKFKNSIFGEKENKPKITKEEREQKIKEMPTKEIQQKVKEYTTKGKIIKEEKKNLKIANKELAKRAKQKAKTKATVTKLKRDIKKG